MKRIIGIASIAIGCLMVVYGFFIKTPEYIFQQIYKFMCMATGGLFIVCGSLSMGDPKLNTIIIQLDELKRKIEQQTKDNGSTGTAKQATATKPVIAKESLDNPNVQRRKGESDTAYWKRVEEETQSDDFKPWQ